MYQLIAGFHEDDTADCLTHDLIFTQLLDTPALTSQPSLSRFFKRFDMQATHQFQMANQALLD
ncbi:transposase [Lysinibacillus sp. NPDC056185]|uniref:transposase n=1 Tax=Lysinibacillus sp. NPDC056185 TaxID=3345739 RepID=UPI0039EF8136